MKLLAMTLGIAALVLPSFADDDWHRGRGDRDRGWDEGYPRGRPYGGSRDRGRYIGSPVAQTIADLQQIERYAYVDHHERGHFRNALNHLYGFQGRLQRNGHWDNGELDRAIGDIGHLVNARQLDPRSREILSHDLYALRDFRANRGYDNQGGYRDYDRDAPYRRW